MKRRSLLLLTMAVGIALALISQGQETAKEVRHVRFLPAPLNEGWTKWIVGQWEGSGQSDTGHGKGTQRIELALNGQFLICRGEAKITEITPQQVDYLKKNMHASDEEIERFKREGYQAMEIYTIDQATGEVVGYLFDSLRCMAKGRGKRQGNREIMEWEWSTGHRSTRITEKVSDDRIVIIQRTPMPDGSVMEEKGESTRKKQPFVHPGILHSRAELEFVKAKVKAGQEPWKSAWEQLRAHSTSQLFWTPKPIANVLRGAYNRPDVGGSNLQRDASAAYSHALQWFITDNPAHAQKAVEILNAYARTLKSVGEHDARLLVGMSGIHFLNAAELMRHTYTGWKPDDQKRFEDLVRNVVHPITKDFYPTANGNWDAAMIQTMLAMGVLLDDRAIFNRAVDYYLTGEGNGAIQKYFNDFGECQESGRDQSHTQMGLGYLGCAAEIAWKQGVDLYGACNNRLALGFEYTAKYNLGFDVPYQPYRSVEGRYNYPAISPTGRGRFAVIYERAYHHYHDRRGMDMPFTKQVLDKTRPEGWQLHHMPWGTLMFAGLPAK